MKSTLFNMTAVLLGITFISSAVVGGVNMITVEPIAKAKEATEQAAMKAVLPEFKEVKSETVTLDDIDVVVSTASAESGVVGYAVKTLTKNGFGGEVSLMVGFTTDGKVYNINVLQHAETPGLGSNMTKVDNPLIRSIKGFNPADKKLVGGRLAVTKDGGDVDALTAATISSRAYVDAVNRAWAAYREVAKVGGEKMEGATGATAPMEGQPAVEPKAEGENAEAANEPVAQEGEKNE